MEQQAASLVSSLVKVDRHGLYYSFKDGLLWSMNAAFSKDNHYTLFRYEDWPAWVLFTTVFVTLIIFDNAILHRNPRSLTIGRAMIDTLFWIVCAGLFCCWVAWWYGSQHAYMWMSGYMLEWLLSFDNLFVFHMIFNAYSTPDHLKHRPLYFGICGAVVFRLVFIFVGEYLMHAMYFMHLVFGGFLIYTGIKTAAVDDDDDDPSQQPLVQWLQKRLPFVGAYDEKGAFFVRVPVNENGKVVLLEEQCESAVRCRAAPVPQECEEISVPESGAVASGKTGSYGTVDFVSAVKFQHGAASAQRPKQVRATMLFLVVVCLELSDLLFAVDSVSAIVAQVNDLFLAYSSACFAMLGLRATFFIIDVLAQVFSLLKYGVAAVLVFIGAKLLLARVYHVPPGVVCMVLVSCLVLSIVASVAQDRWNGHHSEEKRSPEEAVLKVA